MDDKPAEKTIFMDRILKLALEDKIFTEQNVMDELKTVFLAVSSKIPISFNIFAFHDSIHFFCCFMFRFGYAMRLGI